MVFLETENQMKRFLASFFTTLYLLAMIKPALPVIEFYLNQDFIAEFLCINRDKPELQCNGKCHLSKMIESETDNEQAPTIDLREYPVALLNFKILEDTFKNSAEVVLETSYNSDYSYLYFTSLLRPPRC